jgi:hypothetical protein
MKRKLVTVVMLALILANLGCSDKYRKAAEAARDFAVAVQAVQQAEIALHSQGMVDDQEHLQFEGLLVNVASAGKQVDSVILQASKGGNVEAALDAAIQSTNSLLQDGTLHIKNPQAKAQLSAVLLGAKALLDTIAAVIR